MRHTHLIARSLLLIAIASLATTAVAQKYGGTLRAQLRANPVTASLHEESSILATQTFRAVFNNLVMFDLHVKKARAKRGTGDKEAWDAVMGGNCAQRPQRAFWGVFILRY